MRPVVLTSLLLGGRARPLLVPASRDSPAILGFGGTQTWRDVLDDLDVRLCEWPPPSDATVHCGIAHRTDRWWPRVETALEGVDEIVLAGWSLGGAVAVCAAARLHAEGRVRVASVHAFGCPRVGGAAFRDWYQARLGDRTVRYATPRDPIARLPARGYRHVGRVVVVPCHDGHAWWAQHDLRVYRDGLRRLPAS